MEPQQLLPSAEKSMIAAVTVGARSPTVASMAAAADATRAATDIINTWYEPKLVLTGLAILLMSCLDALFTLTLLSKGASEANYFMARLLETGDGLFVAVKLAVTAFAIVFLLMHSHFHVLRITSGKRLLQFVVPVYGLLIGYELVLLGVMRG